MNTYKIKEVVSPDLLTKKIFKFGHSVAWVSTWARDDYKIDEWGKVSESKYLIYQSITILDNLKKSGWK